MIDFILQTLATWVIEVISAIGYIGIAVLMGLDSFNIPIPSEVTMPFSGFLAQSGDFSFWLVVFAGTIGSYVGSLVSYYFAGWLIKRRSHPLIGFFLSDSFLEKSSEWFRKYGAASVFFGRLVPIIRTFISLPAGLGRMKRPLFDWLTLLGSFVWCLGLTWIGWILGEHWQDIEHYTKELHWVILALIVLGGVWWMYKHLKGVFRSRI